VPDIDPGLEDEGWDAADPDLWVERLRDALAERSPEIRGIAEQVSWCMETGRPGRLPSRLRTSDDPDGDRHAESGHPVKNVTSNLRLGSLIGQNPGVKAPADEGLVAVYCGFGQAPAIVV